MLYRYRLLNRTGKAHDTWAPIRQIFSGNFVCFLMTIYCFLERVLLDETHKRDRKGLPAKKGYMQIAESCFDALTTPCYWAKCNCRVSAIISRRNKYFNSFAFIVLSFWIFLYFFAHKMPCHILTGCGLKYGSFGNVSHHLTFPLTFRSLIYYFRHPTN